MGDGVEKIFVSDYHTPKVNKISYYMLRMCSCATNGFRTVMHDTEKISRFENVDSHPSWEKLCRAQPSMV